MRIAACLSGQSRTAAYCKPYLDRFFRGHTVDYFIHAWPQDSHHLPLYRPRALSCAVPADLREKERLVIQSFGQYGCLGRIAMYWGIGEAIRLVPNEGYDLIVRLRPDIIPLTRLNAALRQTETSAISFAYLMQDARDAWQPPGRLLSPADPSLAGYHDHLFFGVPQAMRHFETAYDLIESYCESRAGLRFSPAQFLHYVIAAGVETPKRAPISVHLIDADHARSALSLYAFRPRMETRRARDLEHVARHHPDLLPLFSAEPAAPGAVEEWFERGFVPGIGDQASPHLSKAAQKAARLLHQRSL